ncbi:MAG: flagellar export chaperone FliS [Halieaceae bacterium]|jgi:flagellar protein FliS|nr:flagellar export chaperone FliS [Halieaceae bacterium]
MNPQAAMSAYSNTNAHTAVADASPHRLIALLINGAIDRTNAAIGAMQSGDTVRKAELMSKAANIIASLLAYLDKEQGGEVASNLEALYDYMLRRLFHANRHNDAEAAAEVVRLLSEIKAGWDGIAEEVGG